jgi:PIN domain
MTDTQAHMPVSVVLDTNQWRAQYGLRSQLGAALLFLVRQHDGHLALPEVVESEVVKHLVIEGCKAVAQIEAQLRIVQKLTGSMPTVTLPSRMQLEEATSARLQELDDLLDRIPLDVDQSRRALDRVNMGASPNRKKEQFKDSLLWEACRVLAGDHEVHLVTADLAFFEQGYTTLAADLEDECQRDGVTIRAHRDVAHLLGHLRESAPQLDYPRLGELVLERVSEAVNQACDDNGFAVKALSSSSVQAFATEQLDRLVLTFEIEGSLTDRMLSEQGVDRRGVFTVSGEATYNVKSQEVSTATPGAIGITYLDDDGNPVNGGRLLLMTATSYLGSEPPKPIQIRAPIVDAAAMTPGSSELP